jgi:HTH-type transcriptional regulator, competence development regulator
MADSVDFGTALKRFRDERTLSLRELSTLSGVDHAYIHRLESGGKVAPSPEILEKIARGLKLPPHKRQLLEILSSSGPIDSGLLEFALKEPTRMKAVAVAATMSFRGARPTTELDWQKKIDMIEELMGDRG